MAVTNYDSLEKGLKVLEVTQRLGKITVAALAMQPGWTASSASRYLAFMAERGWLDRLGNKRPTYVLGRKVLALAPDLRF